MVTLDQLRVLGLGRGAIASRRQRGLLHLLHVGVYRWGSIDSLRTRVRAAVLACGDASFASHHATLALYGVRPLPGGPVDVTTVGRHVAPRGVRPHRTRKLDPDDRRVVDGIPATSSARALLEVAPELTRDELANAVERAQVMRLVTKGQLAAAIARAGRRPGVAALRALVEERAFTRSQAERLLVSLLRAARLPRPVFNARLEGYEVDALWARERVVLELDSYAFHATRSAFERDRRKSAALSRGRYVVLRTTWDELTRESHDCAPLLDGSRMATINVSPRYALVARVAEALALSAAPSTASPARAGP